MTVGVQGDGHGGVSEQRLNELRVDIPLEQERSAGVAQVVEGDVGQTRTL